MPDTRPMDLRARIYEPEIAEAMRRILKDRYHNVHGAAAVLVKVALKSYLIGQGYIKNNNNCPPVEKTAEGPEL